MTIPFRRWQLPWVLLIGLSSAIRGSAHADPRVDLTPPQSSDAPTLVAANPTAPPDTDGFLTSYFENWQNRVDAARASQPEWSSPVVTTTAMLEQRFRFDTQYQTAGNGTKTWDVDGGKGLDFIPFADTEFQIGAPPYDVRSSDAKHDKGELDGFADWPLFRVKERLASSPESAGDYVVSAWLQLQDAAGIKPLTNNSFTLLPTIGFGKGWGPFDLQGTVGATIPTDHESELGTQLSDNMALQYHLGTFFWPQIESNVTYWTDGQRAHRTQVFLTPGLVVGRFPINDSLKFTVGLGYQVAVTPHYRASPLLPAYNRAWILTTRLSF